MAGLKACERCNHTFTHRLLHRRPPGIRASLVYVHAHGTRCSVAVGRRQVAALVAAGVPWGPWAPNEIVVDEPHARFPCVTPGCENGCRARGEVRP